MAAPETRTLEPWPSPRSGCCAERNNQTGDPPGTRALKRARPALAARECNAGGGWQPWARKRAAGRIGIVG
eukprot:11166889-Lingulodinium_polyedra.AAC.1